MLRSLYSGISGLKSHQVDLDVIAQNIANVNTPGYKAGRVLFADLLYQTLKDAQAPSASRGGTNPVQAGMGVGVAAIDMLMGQGILQPTGIASDLAIDGEGFFAVQDSAGATLLTRAGAFRLDTDGYLVHAPSGSRLLGWNAQNGQVNTNSTPEVLKLDLGLFPPRATTTVHFAGNLDARTASGSPGTIRPNVLVYDSLGNSRELALQFRRGSGNSWTVDVLLDGTQVSQVTLSFDSNGNVTTGDAQQSVTVDLDGDGTAGETITLDFTGITQYALPDDVYAARQDGTAGGELEEITVDASGQIIGRFSNNEMQLLGQIALATVTNPAGLAKEGSSLLRTTANSGAIRWGTAASGSRGKIESGRLEMSNVDLAEEFANMIVAQRGFQANTRVITATDEILQEVINLRR
ncbi:MAG: flagellar hook protein FlgE [Limnochordales bacterium]|nr:flagellar hook protein FlgE [Limnochordales bacterium]